MSGLEVHLEARQREDVLRPLLGTAVPTAVPLLESKHTMMV